ncbi:hypothetical protein B5X24_HaOG206682 [Helicoverpa armigera]|nr:hypothetical protein B5X24_HaOG206682 [Helicoverpa armigera]
MDLYIAFWCLIFVHLVNAKTNVTNPDTKKPNTTILEDGAGNKKTKNQSNLFINFNNLEAHVQPLPELKEKLPRLAVYTSLFQGARHEDDERVFRKRFDFEAQPEGQKIITKGLFDCLLTYLALESTVGIPVLLRGGVGYRHFTAVVRSKPYKELKGQVRAYCRKNNVEKQTAVEMDKPQAKRRRFYFGDRLNEDNDSSS